MYDVIFLQDQTKFEECEMACTQQDEYYLLSNYFGV